MAFCRGCLLSTKGKVKDISHLNLAVGGLQNLCLKTFSRWMWSQQHPRWYRGQIHSSNFRVRCSSSPFTSWFHNWTTVSTVSHVSPCFSSSCILSPLILSLWFSRVLLMLPGQPERCAGQGSRWGNWVLCKEGQIKLQSCKISNLLHRANAEINFPYKNNRIFCFGHFFKQNTILYKIRDFLQLCRGLISKWCVSQMSKCLNQLDVHLTRHLNEGQRGLLPNLQNCS